MAEDSRLAEALAELQVALLRDEGMSLETSATLGLMGLSGNLRLVAGPERAIEVLRFCADQIENGTAPTKAPHLRLIERDQPG